MLKGAQMSFFKKTSKNNVELVGGDMDGIITVVQEALPELEFESLVYPPGYDLSGNQKETGYFIDLIDMKKDSRYPHSGSLYLRNH